MKILHFIWSMNIGGSENMLVDITNEQSKYHNIVLCIGNADVDEGLVRKVDQAVRVVRLNRPPGSRNPLHLVWLNAAIRFQGADIIHTHHDSLITGLMRPAVPVVLTVHDTKHQLGCHVHLYAKVFCISDAVRRDVEARYPGCNLTTNYNGIPVNQIQTRRGKASTKFRIVQVGRLDHAKKGQDILLKALRKILDESENTDVSIDFIGGGSSEEYLRQMAQQLGLVCNCFFLGPKSREYVYQNLKNYDLLVQPSRYEGFGLTVAEGMAANLPVLVSNNEGPMEIIGGGEFGYWFETGNEEACARQIMAVMRRQHESSFAREREKAREHVLGLFDIKRTAANYLYEYSKILGATVPLEAPIPRGTR